MKAIVHIKYGPPEVAKVQETAIPIPKENELLIKVMASTVNRTDAGLRSAEYFISRFWTGLFRPKIKTLGSEFSGIVQEIGADVCEFKIGDKVFGYNDSRFGGHAEFMTITDEDVAIIPKNLSFEEAAALTEGAHYALNFLTASKVQKGQHALVYGATGAIGSAAVQLLKHFGVKVTAVCNTKNVELVKSLGADLVIDYEKQDFTIISDPFDFAFDAVGKTSFKKCKPLLTEKGIYISTELGKNGQNVFYALFTRMFKGKKVLFPIPTMNKEMLLVLKDLVQNGEFKPVIDRFYSLDQIVEAYHYVQSGQKTGNVVLKIGVA
jgi:NADPH:quinone reductase-like Zn-dependent oxidoreductase